MKHDAERILHALKEARAKLECEKDRRTEPLAVVGMACRFPGGANSPEQFWDNLCERVDAIGDYPVERFPQLADMNAGREGGFLADIDQFDPQFFGISPREAETIDPQQKLLLEVAWEALERAGQVPDRLGDNDTGVFVGITFSDYGRHLAELGNNPHLVTGNTLNAAAGRLSYVFGLSGPSLAIDTACSSSLVAVHQACQSLRNRECRQALAGGVNLILAPDVSIAGTQSGMLSTDGRCRAFDAAAGGIGRGEGCGIVVLKRLSDAIADGDRILAQIRGSAVNNDGPSSGFFVPNGLAQQKVIRQALANGLVEPGQVQYIEAHGTGTSLGDPIEVSALSEVFRDTQGLLLGSVKTNVGHLESAAGIAGLIKVILAMQHGQLPASLHCQEPSPHIAWEASPVRVVKGQTKWAGRDGVRIAGVSSFGASGTNSHLVLEGPPPAPEEHLAAERPWHILRLSARSEGALRTLAARFAKQIAETDDRCADICYTANTGRGKFCENLTVVAASNASLSEALFQVAAGEPDDRVRRSKTQNKSGKVACLFTGQGAQYADMGLALYRSQPVFAAALDRCTMLLAEHMEVPLLDVLYGEEKDTLIHQTQYTQPAMFALEVALLALWRSWGIEPQAVMGHSVGEYVAAYAAGVFSLEDGLKLISARGRLMQELPGNGAMIVVLDSVENVRQQLIAGVSIAAVNGPRNTVISGAKGAVAEVADACKRAGSAVHPLTVSHAFHSELMEPMLEAFLRIAQSVDFAPARIPVVSNVSGAFSEGELETPAYWCQHIREAVQFEAGVRSLRAAGYETFLELGPKPILTGMARHCVPAGEGRWLPGLVPGADCYREMLTSVAELHAAGVRIQWHGLDAPGERRRCLLPTYPFERQRSWFAAPAEPEHEGQFVWEEAIDTQRAPYLLDHRLDGQIVIAGGMLLEVIYASLKAFDSGTDYVLADVQYTQMIFLPEDATQTIRVVISGEPGQDVRFSLYNRQSLPEQTDWIVNGTGRAVPVEAEVKA